MHQRLTTLLVTLACAGCTSSIGVVRVDPDQPATRVGVAYHLPFSRFEVSVKRMVTACTVADITLATSVEAVAAPAESDPDHAYAIDPNSLMGVFRVGALKAEYGKGGLVKSVNATSEDRTAQVLSAVAAGVIKLATLPVPMPVVAANDAGGLSACNSDTLAALSALPNATAEVKQASNELAVRAATYKTLQDRVSALGGIVDETTRRALVEARARSDDAAVSLAGKKTRLDKLKEALSHTDKFLWPQRGSEFRSLRPAPANLMALWKNPTFTGPLSQPSPIDLRLVVDTAQPDLVPKSATPSEPIAGLPYRMPRSGYLLACDGDCSPANQMALLPATVLQLGMPFYLPCKSQTFGSTACTFTADEGGVPTSAGSEIKSAAAENAAGSFKDLATQYAGLKVARRDAEKQAYEAETARLKAKAEYEKAIATPTPPAVPQALTDQTALLKAYVDYYTAMKAYTDAKNVVTIP